MKRKFRRRTGGASFYSKRVKPVRKYNRGKLRLQRALTRGGSLPFETSTHVYYRGMATTQGTNQTMDLSAGDLMQMFSNVSAADQTFILNRLGGPCINTSASPSYGDGKFGKFSYQDVWASMYSKALVMGSKIVIHIRKSLYPSLIGAIRNQVLDPVGTNFSPGLAQAALASTDIAAGFWYIRYRYYRAAKQGDAPDAVGHPMWWGTTNGSYWYTDSTPGEALIWANQRDFMCDPTVTWIRDRLPRATKMKYSRSYSDQTTVASTYQQLSKNRKNLFPIQDDSNGRVEYELELSNRPTKLIAAYSRRRHSEDENPLRNSVWQDLSSLRPISILDVYGNDLTPEQHVAQEQPLFQVRVGYVCFAQNGAAVCNIPADRLGHYLDIQCAYKIRLREPKISPWTGEKQGMDVEFSSRVPLKTDVLLNANDELDEELDSELDNDDVFSDDGEEEDLIPSGEEVLEIQ